MEQKLEQLRVKLSHQAADLVNKAKIPPIVLATMLIDLAVALPLSMGVPAAEIAISLHAHAARLEQLEAGEDQGDPCLN